MRKMITFSHNVHILIFSATLRDNLDPLKSHNDAKLWDSLKKARLSDVVKNKLAPLDPYVGGRGLDALIDHETTFSAGKISKLIVVKIVVLLGVFMPPPNIL